MTDLFTDYFISKTNDKITIRGKLQYEGLGKWGNTFLTFLIYMFVPLFIYYYPVSGNIIMVTYGKFILMALTFFLTWKLLNKYVAPKVQASPILEINKKKNILISQIDTFTTPLADIKDISITEETSEEGGLQYRLLFKLPDGEKSSIFAFTSYNKLDEILKEIKKAIDVK